MGPGISIIETGEAVARQLKSKLNEFNLNANLSASNDFIKIILTGANRNSSHKINQFLAESNIKFEIENSWC